MESTLSHTHTHIRYKVANTLATSQSKQFASHSSSARTFLLSLLLGVFFVSFFLSLCSFVLCDVWKSRIYICERACEPLSLVFRSDWADECYWYAESQLYVSHNHSEYFIDISDHSDRFTDSLFFRSLRWIDVFETKNERADSTRTTQRYEISISIQHLSCVQIHSLIGSINCRSQEI